MTTTNRVEATLRRIGVGEVDADGLRFTTYRVTFTEADIPELAPGETAEAEAKVYSGELTAEDAPEIVAMLRATVRRARQRRASSS